MQVGQCFTIVRWRERDGGDGFHARYVLTELGGIRFDCGLDPGHPGRTTDVTLLDRNLHAQRWEAFQLADTDKADRRSAFDLADTVSIAGSRGM